MPDRGPTSNSRDRKTLPAVLFLLLALFLSACGQADSRTRLDLPGTDLSELVGFALLEKTEFQVKDHGPSGLTAIHDSVSFYYGRLWPYDIPLRFELDGAGRVYLAWVPVRLLSGRPETVEIVLSSHLIQDFEGSREGHEVLFKPVRFKAEITPGRATFIGEITRRITYRISGDDKLFAVAAVEGNAAGDLKALHGLLLDNPWLAERLSLAGQ